MFKDVIKATLMTLALGSVVLPTAAMARGGHHGGGHHGGGHHGGGHHGGHRGGGHHGGHHGGGHHDGGHHRHREDFRRHFGPGFRRGFKERRGHRVVERIVFRGGRRIVVDRPFPVFVGGGRYFERGATIGGGRPAGLYAGACSTTRQVSFTSYGWKKVATTRTCLFPG